MDFQKETILSHLPVLLPIALIVLLEFTVMLLLQMLKTQETVYQFGDVIYVSYPSVPNIEYLFSTPSSGFSNTCQDNNPVKYLVSRNSSCSRVISDTTIQNVCSSSALNFETYSNAFQIYQQPSSSLVSINVDGCMVDGAFGNCFAPSFDAATSTCSNAVTSASYVITTEGQNGIIAVNVSFMLENVQVTNSPLLQSFSVAYSSTPVGGDAPFDRSGNPGYVIGFPLLSAARLQDTSITAVSNILQNSVIGVEISLINLDPTGFCDPQAQNRLLVSFGVDKRTGCRITVNDRCNDLGTFIQNTLDGPTYDAFDGAGVVFVGT